MEHFIPGEISSTFPIRHDNLTLPRLQLSVEKLLMSSNFRLGILKSPGHLRPIRIPLNCGVVVDMFSRASLPVAQLVGKITDSIHQ